MGAEAVLATLHTVCVCDGAVVLVLLGLSYGC